MKKRRIRKDRVLILVGILLAIIGVIVLINHLAYKNSNEYKLKSIGYTKEQINDLAKLYDKNQIKNILTRELNPDIISLAKEKYFIYDNLDRYLEYAKKNKDKTKTDVVSIVNVKADVDWYDKTYKVEVNDENQYLILVNKVNYLDETYDPDDIVNTGLLYSYAGNSLRKEVYGAFISMYTAAKEENLNLIINSSYRSFANQKSIYDDRVLSTGVKAADSYAARPGHSEHQTGLALDIDAFGNDNPFEESDEFKWMQEHAHEYGFILRYPKDKEYLTGYSYESWHYRYLGVEMATKVKESNLTYDEYYAYYCEYKKECF